MSRKERFTPQVLKKKNKLVLTTLRGIVPDQKYVVNFIFLQEPFKIGQPYIKNMVLQDLQRKLKIVLIQNNLRLK